MNLSVIFYFASHRTTFFFFSGQNWLAQILYLIHNDGIPVSHDDILRQHVLPVGRSPIGTHNTVNPDNMPSPRHFRSHLEAKFFQHTIENKKTKFIVIMRNVKDVLVSYYYMHKSTELLGNFQGSFPEFVGMYKEGRLQDWFQWNLGWWKYREYPNILFVKYEEMKKDFPGQVRRIMEYLNLNANDDIIFRVCQSASFQQMAKGISKSEHLKSLCDHNVSPFMRKGQVGDWKTHFTPEINDYIDRLYFERLTGSGLHFDFEWCAAPHDDVIKCKHFPRYWPFVRGIQRSPVNSPQSWGWRSKTPSRPLWRHCNDMEGGTYFNNVLQTIYIIQLF